MKLQLGQSRSMSFDVSEQYPGCDPIKVTFRDPTAADRLRLFKRQDEINRAASIKLQKLDEIDDESVKQRERSQVLEESREAIEAMQVEEALRIVESINIDATIEEFARSSIGFDTLKTLAHQVYKPPRVMRVGEREAPSGSS